MEKLLIKGVAKDENVARLALIGPAGYARYRIQNFLAARGEKDQCRYYFTVNRPSQYKGHQLYGAACR